MMSKASRRLETHGAKFGGIPTSYAMNDDDSHSSNHGSSLKKHRIHPFNLKECDAGQQTLDIDAATTRTEMSTDLDDVSVQQRFSFASTSLYNANGGASTSHAMSFESNTAIFPSTTGHRIVDVIDTSGSYEMISQLTGPKDVRQEAYHHSLLDLDEDDAFDSPKNLSSWGESMFIGTNDELDTESRMNFYTVPDSMKNAVGTRAVRERLQTMQSTGSMFNASDGALDTESRFGFYKQESIMASNRSVSVDTDSRDDFNIVNDAEEPPSCRDKMGPVLSFTDEGEFDWLTQTTMKIEAKKKEQKHNVMECGDGGSGVASNLRSFVTRCGSCFSPP
ncbi:hypothetical protein ACHAWO_002248 [Cyclotella atomus]|uniref:Uncharacterized protein n=1 Tax=Cyclotella atomus TaxID=382360 RepID=A0ABD3N672_9STRA